MQVLFAGNGLAVHDIETALYGTSLGVYLDKKSAPAKAMNIISGRSTRSEKPAASGKRSSRGSFSVEYFYSCVRKGVDFVLAGSIRDDGPLPDVITDS